MAKKPSIYQKEGLGWFIEMADRLEGPLDSREEAHSYLKLILLACAARNEIACLDKECFV